MMRPKGSFERSAPKIHSMTEDLRARPQSYFVLNEPPTMTPAAQSDGVGEIASRPLRN